MGQTSKEMARRPALPERGVSAFFIVKCHAPRKKPRFEGQLCDGFVGRYPHAVRFVRIIDHSDVARSSSFVAPCQQCGRLHELVRGS